MAQDPAQKPKHCAARCRRAILLSLATVWLCAFRVRAPLFALTWQPRRNGPHPGRGERVMRLEQPVVARPAFLGMMLPWEEELDLDDSLRARFSSYADGSEEDGHIQPSEFRSLLECTDSFCLTKHWLPDEYVQRLYSQYATTEGVGLREFAKLSRDGLLLKGKLEEYEAAFTAIDQVGDGVITRAELGQAFAALGHVMAADELDRIVEEADVGHDGIDFADFLGLAREHLDLAEVLQYVAASPLKPSDHLPVDLSSAEFQPGAGLGEVTTVHGEAELDAILRTGDDVVVELAFTWCRPCKAFWPKYQRLSQQYRWTRFVKIVGNENESCKHFAREVLQAKISPMFAAYSQGSLVKTWTGANLDRFVSSIEAFLPTARAATSSR
mmetsp:Transcript_41281/g.95014  ORF Transcript_41281/g.95014 Transcript_41281/m.95014 type:complete len:384 (+) Transcript_41281:74-1225(+)